MDSSSNSSALHGPKLNLSDVDVAAHVATGKEVQLDPQEALCLR